jgi:hypothetical protein
MDMDLDSGAHAGAFDDASTPPCNDCGEESLGVVCEPPPARPSGVLQRNPLYGDDLDGSGVDEGVPSGLPGGSLLRKVRLRPPKRSRIREHRVYRIFNGPPLFVVKVAAGTAWVRIEDGRGRPYALPLPLSAFKDALEVSRS